MIRINFDLFEAPGVAQRKTQRLEKPENWNCWALKCRQNCTIVKTKNSTNKAEITNIERLEIIFCRFQKVHVIACCLIKSCFKTARDQQSGVGTKITRRRSSSVVFRCPTKLSTRRVCHCAEKFFKSLAGRFLTAFLYFQLDFIFVQRNCN